MEFIKREECSEKEKINKQKLGRKKGRKEDRRREGGGEEETKKREGSKDRRKE